MNEGITDFDWEVAQVEKAILKSAERRAVLSISEKLESRQNFQVCKRNALDHLATELDPGYIKLAFVQNRMHCFITCRAS